MVVIKVTTIVLGCYSRMFIIASLSLSLALSLIVIVSTGHLKFDLEACPSRLTLDPFGQLSKLVITATLKLTGVSRGLWGLLLNNFSFLMFSIFPPPPPPPIADLGP